MARVTCTGETLYTDGSFPGVGRVLGPHTLTDTNWDDVRLDAIGGLKVLEIFPSVDSPKAAQSASQLSELSLAFPSASMFIVSSDLPCALQNWRLSHGFPQIGALSAFRSHKFVSANGLMISSGRFKGLCSRATLVIDGGNSVLHASLALDLMDGMNLNGLQGVLAHHASTVAV